MEAIGRDKKRTSEGLGFVLSSDPRAALGRACRADRVRAAVMEPSR